tara:strand:+ start:7552 stop:7818 length:267 start_codon:yes stop_codon:yes gene_type:complete
LDKVLKDYVTTFKTPAGERVLKHLETMFGVRDTIEPEEMLNKHLEATGETKRCPIDSHAMAKRLGLRSAYWKIHAILERAEETLERTK